MTVVLAKDTAPTLEDSPPPVARRRRPIALVIGVTMIGVWVVSAIAWPWLVPFDPAHFDITHRFAAPSREHLLGTDQFGRDTFSRLLAGARWRASWPSG